MSWQTCCALSCLSYALTWPSRLAPFPGVSPSDPLASYSITNLSFGSALSPGVVPRHVIQERDGDRARVNEGVYRTTIRVRSSESGNDLILIASFVRSLSDDAF